MTWLKINKVWFLTLGVLLAVGGFYFLGKTNVSNADLSDPLAGKTEKYMFVWAGDQMRKNPDFLAVVNFDERSADYGRVITTVPLTGTGATWNEPHHVGLSRDGRVLACGGLLSVLKGQKEVFFFDVSNAGAPKFISSADPPQSAIADEFYPLADGGFLVTMMGGAQGHHPGRIAEFGKDLKLTA